MKNSLIIRYLMLFLLFIICVMPLAWLIKFFNKMRDDANLFHKDCPAYSIRHLGVMIDGNRRWARAHHTTYSEGFIVSGQKLFDTISICLEEGIPMVTFYVLSCYNFERRTIEEIYDVLTAISEILSQKKKWFLERDVCVKVYGNREVCVMQNDARDIAREKARILYATIDDVCKYTARGKRLVCNLLIIYNPIDDLLHDTKNIAAKIASGELKENMVDRNMLYESILTKDIPAMDLILRTGGISRLNGFMPIQSMFSEIEVIPNMWPDVSLEHMRQLIRAFPLRVRNYGK